MVFNSICTQVFYHVNVDRKPRFLNTCFHSCTAACQLCWQNCHQTRPIL